jgi:flagellar biosynthesis protein FlhF
MRIKSFSGPSIAKTMDYIRSELGEEAVILSCVEGHQQVRITAALDLSPHQKATLGPLKLQKLIDQAPHLTTPFTPSLHAAEIISRSFEHHNVPGMMMDQLLPTVTRSLSHLTRSTGGASPGEALALAFGEHYGFTPLDMATLTTPLMLIGPPGVGKTVTLVKLGVTALKAGRQVQLITTDQYKAGAVDQVSTLSQALGVQSHVAPTPQQLGEVLARMPAGVLPLIDTPGINPFLPSDLHLLNGLIFTVRHPPVVVLASGGDPKEAADICLAFKGLGANRLMVTKIDTSRRFGHLLAMGEVFKFCQYSTSPYIAQSLCSFSPQSLAQLFLTGFSAYG